jgi:hypothetical protein
MTLPLFTEMKLRTVFICTAWSFEFPLIKIATAKDKDQRA